jgi:hypothetical protein
MTAFGIGAAHDLSEPEALSTQEAAMGRATAADHPAEQRVEREAMRYPKQALQ